MTIGALDYRYAGMGAFRTSGATWGVSEDAQLLADRFSDLAGEVWRTAAGFHRYNEPVEQLVNLYRDCKADDWNGEGARAVTEPALNDALTLSILLPADIPCPTYLPEPSGAVALEWYKDPKRVLILSVNGTQSIQYAAILGDGNESHGKVNFAGSLPRAVSNLLDLFAEA